jgi:transposase, IS5 family
MAVKRVGQLGFGTAGWGGRRLGADRHGPATPANERAEEALQPPISRTRAAVETTFATAKCRMGFTIIRYRGLAKASAQITMVAIAFNLRRWARIAPA